MIKQNEAISHKNLLDEYNSAVKQKETFRNIEREQDVNQALNMEATARQSLYKENNKRKELLSKFKNDLRADYQKQ
jgi:hypothetical protein